MEIFNSRRKGVCILVLESILFFSLPSRSCMCVLRAQPALVVPGRHACCTVGSTSCEQGGGGLHDTFQRLVPQTEHLFQRPSVCFWPLNIINLKYFCFIFIVDIIKRVSAGHILASHQRFYVYVRLI